MSALHLFHLDVFAQRRYQGNPLAVVIDQDPGERLEPAGMQAIARELHLSETAFVLPPGPDGGSAYSLRIFTPAVELPFAGHPSVGSAWLLAHLGRIPTGVPVDFEVPAGRLEARVESGLEEDGGPAWVSAPEPVPATAAHGDSAAVLAAVGLSTGDLAGPEPETWDTGSLHHITLLKPGTKLAGIDPDLSALKAAFPGGGCLFAVLDDPGRVTARYFAPALGITEDPATGSAVAALAGCLAARRPRALAGGRVVVHQGAELGQPSVLEAAWTPAVGGAPARTEIGGRCHLLYEAELPYP
jgi:trans-2,3-dihydro-3-hydroxyanthranilate isomerase